MADTTALKNRIRAAIKSNDNQEITGPVLQQALLDMVDELNGATEYEAESTLQQSIDAEKTRAEGAESTLQQSIGAEKTRAEGAEQNLAEKFITNEVINNKRILYDDFVDDDDYYTTPFLPYGNGNLVWTVSEINNDAMLVMYNASFVRQNQARATSATIGRSDGGAYAYLRAVFKKNQVGNITVGGKIIWDNSKVDELVIQNLRDFVYQKDIIDNLNSTSASKPLSAKQGNELKTLVTAEKSRAEIAEGMAGIVLGILRNGSINPSADYYVTPFISVQGGNLLTWHPSEINENVDIEIFDSSLVKKNQWVASTATVSNSLPSDIAYIRCGFKFNGVGDITVGNLKVWDNTKVEYPAVKGRMDKDKDLFDLIAKFNQLLSDGWVFVGFASTSTTPISASISGEKIFYIASEAGSYHNFIDNGGNEIVVDSNGISILRTTTIGGNVYWTKDTTLTYLASKTALAELKTYFHEFEKASVKNLDRNVTYPSAANVNVGYVTSTQGVISLVTSMYKYIIVDIRGFAGKAITVISAAKNPRYAFLKTIPQAAGAVDLANSNSYDLTQFPNKVQIPVGANYLYLDVSYASSSEYIIMPESIIIEDYVSLSEKQNAIKKEKDAGQLIDDIADQKHTVIIRCSSLNLLNPNCQDYWTFSSVGGVYNIVSSGYKNCNFFKVEPGKKYRVSGDLSSFNSNVLRYLFTAEMPNVGVATITSGSVSSGGVITAPANAHYLVWNTGSASITQISSQAMISEGEEEHSYVPYAGGTTGNIPITISDDEELHNSETLTCDYNGIVRCDSRYPSMYISEVSGIKITAEYIQDIKAYIASLPISVPQYIEFGSGDGAYTRIGPRTDGATLYGCVAVGDNCLPNNTGTKNVTVGNDNMSADGTGATTTGNKNTSMGYHSLFRLTSGETNATFGAEAGDDCTSGSNNTAMGAYSMQRNRLGGSNTAVGAYALKGSDGEGGQGTAPGRSNIGNTVIGANALRGANHGCNFNIAVGLEAMRGSGSRSHCIVIGNYTEATKDYQMIIGSSDINEVVICGNKKINFNSDGTVTWETINVS